MEKFLKLITFSLFAALVVFASCGGGDDDDDDNNDSGPDPVDEIVEALTGGAQVDWTLTDGQARLDNVAVEEWNGLVLNLSGDASGLNYTTTGSQDQTVWPTSGTWTFVDGSNGNTADRSDGIQIDIASVSETSLRLEFDISSARTNGIEGTWSFTFTR